MPNPPANKPTNQGVPPAPDGPLKSYAEKSEQADKILSFLGKVLGFVGGILWAAYGWLEEQAQITPLWLLQATIAVSLVVGLTLCLWAYRSRIRWGRWRFLLVSILGGLLLGLAVVVLFVMPPSPAWERLDVPKILLQNPPKQDLPFALMRDELTGRNGSLPGGQTYAKLLEAKRGTERLSEQWACYYSPVLAPSTMPKSVSLKTTGKLNPQNASVGVYVFVWNEASGRIQVLPAQEFGYKSLRTTVDLDVPLTKQDHVAVMIFVYPLNAEASRNLPDSLDEVLTLE